MQVGNETAVHELAGAATLFQQQAQRYNPDRDSAWWQHTTQVANWIDHYCPIHFGDPPTQLRPFYANLEALIEALQEARAGNEGPIAALFGQWRAHVTDCEAICAGRLQVLAGAVAMLREMRERAHDVAPVDARIKLIGQYVVSQYRVIQPVDVPLRLWCSKVTRRYDLLPGEWRHL